MKHPRKLYVAYFCLFVSLLSCSSPDYSEKNFDYFRKMSENDGIKAIKELRYFVHYNPKHAEANMILSKLLMENAQVDRDYYLAQHYVQEAINYSKTPKVSSTAADIYLQIQLLRGAAPGDPKKLVELAKFALDKKQPDLASQNYIKAAREFLTEPDIGNAQNCAQKAASILEEMLASPKSNENKTELQTRLMISKQILATTHILRSKYEESSKYLDYINSAGIKHQQPEFLPDISYLSSAVEIMTQVIRPGLLVRMKFWGDKSEVDLERLKSMLEESDRINRDVRNFTRDRLSKMVCENIDREIDKSRAPEIVALVEKQVRFYTQRLEIE